MSSRLKVEQKFFCSDTKELIECNYNIDTIYTNYGENDKELFLKQSLWGNSKIKM